MPNGADRNWVRLKRCLEEFHAKYGYWPSKVRLMPICHRDLRERLFTPTSWARVCERIEFVPEQDTGFIVEGEAGHVCPPGPNVPWGEARMPAEEWLGVTADGPAAHDPD